MVASAANEKPPPSTASPALQVAVASTNVLATAGVPPDTAAYTPLSSLAPTASAAISEPVTASSAILAPVTALSWIAALFTPFGATLVAVVAVVALVAFVALSAFAALGT